MARLLCDSRREFGCQRGGDQVGLPAAGDGASSGRFGEGSEPFHQIQEAYSVLSDPAEGGAKIGSVTCVGIATPILNLSSPSPLRPGRAQADKVTVEHKENMLVIKVPKA
jgi:hypothetical protein